MLFLIKQNDCVSESTDPASGPVLYCLVLLTRLLWSQHHLLLTLFFYISLSLCLSGVTSSWKTFSILQDQCLPVWTLIFQLVVPAESIYSSAEHQNTQFVVVIYRHKEYMMFTMMPLNFTFRGSGCSLSQLKADLICPDYHYR